VIRQQALVGASFSEPRRWLRGCIAALMASSAGVVVEGLHNAPFIERGGTDGVLRDMGTEAARYLEQLNAELTA
jgi:type I restriction enzyme R subunit